MSKRIYDSIIIPPSCRGERTAANVWRVVEPAITEYGDRAVVVVPLKLKSDAPPALWGDMVYQ